MIMDAIKARFRRWACPGCDGECDAAERRLDRAEQLHLSSTVAITIEARKQRSRTSDIRLVASSVLGSLGHSADADEAVDLVSDALKSLDGKNGRK